MIDNKITIKGDASVDMLRGAIGHRATWTGLTYVNAQKAGKADEAEKMIRDAITQTGEIHGAGIKSRCGDPNNVASFSEAFVSPTVVKTFEMDFKTKTADRLDIEFHHCPLLKAWQELGIDDKTCGKLCDMAMDGDRGIAKAMGLEFHLGTTIANGGSKCEVSFYKKGK
jgi:hypothetical protein